MRIVCFIVMAVVILVLSALMLLGVIWDDFPIWAAIFVVAAWIATMAFAAREGK